MGTREAGAATTAPGYRRWDDAGARAEIATLWNVDVSILPTERGRAYPDIIDGIIDGTIKGLWVIGTNPVVSFPHRARLEAAFVRLELLVVQDIFPTPTTARAHIVLPAAMWGEKDGTYTNTERRVSRARRAVAPPGADFPFVLNTGRTVEHWHTRTKTGRIGILEGLVGDAWIEINPRDADRLSMANGDRVRVVSRRGRIDGVLARVTATVRAGEAFIPFHFDEWCANRLTVAEFDPVSREPNYKQCAVRLERDLAPPS